VIKAGFLVNLTKNSEKPEINSTVLLKTTTMSVFGDAFGHFGDQKKPGREPGPNPAAGMGKSEQFQRLCRLTRAALLAMLTEPGRGKSDLWWVDSVVLAEIRPQPNRLAI